MALIFWGNAMCPLTLELRWNTTLRYEPVEAAFRINEIDRVAWIKLESGVAGGIHYDVTSHGGVLLDIRSLDRKLCILGSSSWREAQGAHNQQVRLASCAALPRGLDYQLVAAAELAALRPTPARI